jgi:hypothetical protein
VPYSLADIAPSSLADVAPYRHEEPERNSGESYQPAPYGSDAVRHYECLIGRVVVLALFVLDVVSQTVRPAQPVHVLWWPYLAVDSKRVDSQGVRCRRQGKKRRARNACEVHSNEKTDFKQRVSKASRWKREADLETGTPRDAKEGDSRPEM